MEPCLQLALRWREHNDVVMFTDYLPGENVEKNLRSMADRAPCPLVIMRAWETAQWAPQVPEQAKVFKKGPDHDQRSSQQVLPACFCHHSS
jgi:hypothetical protein